MLSRIHLGAFAFLSFLHVLTLQFCLQCKLAGEASAALTDSGVGVCAEEEWRTTAVTRCAGATETCLIKPSDAIKSQRTSAPNVSDAAESTGIAF